MYLSVTENQAVSILLMIVISIIIIVLIMLFYRSIKKERVNFLERSGKDDIFSESQMNDFIVKKIETANIKTAFTVLKIELNDYITLKENFGEVQYSNLLSEIEQKLIKILPERTKISFNEKTFTCYMGNNYSSSQQGYLANMILAEFQTPFTLVGALKIEIDVNLCLSSYPEGGKSAKDFLRSLDLAMIVSKRKGLNNFIIFNKALKNEDTEEYRYYKEIKSAIENKEFLLYFQPIVDMKTLEVIGAESLLRWNHKTLGVLPPSKFLNIIEQSGDIYWVGLWAFEQLIKQSHIIKRAIPDKNITINMNLSPRQLINPELASEINRIIKKHKAKASDFCFEIVEFAMFDKHETIKTNINTLRRSGFKIAIDNYGLELASLSQLSTLPIDVIKIDKAFLAQLDDNVMVENIVEMLNKFAQNFNIQIIAEGIETKEALDKMRNFNLKYAQGFLFSQPKDLNLFLVDADILPWQEALN